MLANERLCIMDKEKIEGSALRKAWKRPELKELGTVRDVMGAVTPTIVQTAASKT